MKPPTEEELNEVVDDGFALDKLKEPLWMVEANIIDRKLELENLEITLQITMDRWEHEKKILLDNIRFRREMLEVSEVYFDDDPDVAAQDLVLLNTAKEKYKKEEKEFEEGLKKTKDKIERKKRELAVVADINATTPTTSSPPTARATKNTNIVL